MLFNPEALRNKQKHLDALLRSPETVAKVVGMHLPGPVEITPLPRIWEPGGGATLYRLQTQSCQYLLKVKHRSCTVESRLESEGAWSNKSSLENEYEFIRRIGQDWTPRVTFFTEHEGFHFLALEWLTPFPQAVEALSALELLDAWRQIEHGVRSLYEMNIVHTDVHEFNICFRGAQPVLCDFEEARELAQSVPHEESLDVIGENAFGNVGRFPKGHSAVEGLTCLKRLEKVFRALVKQRLPALLERCRFDNSCPFNLDELQEPDERIYQSVRCGDLQVKGQRPQRDRRLMVFRYLLCRLTAHYGALRHLDIGSNLGVFCLAAARYPFVTESVGVEAYRPYVDCARCIAFMEGATRTKFEVAICGQDPLSSVVPSADMVSLLSVYHHIRNKEAFLKDLRSLGIKHVLAEFATQKRYYPERGSLDSELAFIQGSLGLPCRYVLCTSADYRRPIVLFSAVPLGTVEYALARWSSSRLAVVAQVILFLAEQLAARSFRGRRA